MLAVLSPSLATAVFNPIPRLRLARGFTGSLPRNNKPANMKAGSSSMDSQNNNREAFTVIDLIAVIGVLVLFGLFMTPAWAGADKGSAHVLQCRFNLRQLHGGWQAYSDDNNGALAPTGDTGSPSIPQWCLGRMDVLTDSTNPTPIQQGLIWPYVKALSAYKCPADPNRTSSGTPTVRSVSMNCWMNPITSATMSGLSGPARVFRKQADIPGAMSPSMSWVLIDESQRSINDVSFVISGNPTAGANNSSWVDVPASYHNFAASLVFADGHVELKRWTDGKVPLGTVFTPADSTQNPPYADLRWLQERSTVPQ